MFKWKPNKETLFAFFLAYLMVFQRNLPIPFWGSVICGFIIPIYYLIFKKNQPLSEIGITKDKWLLSIILGTYCSLFPHLLQLLNPSNRVNKIIINFGAIGYMLQIMIFGSIEVIFFYGFLNLRLRKALGIIPAIILSAIFLTFVRVDPLHPEFLPMFTITLVNMVTFSLTKNLLAVFPANYLIGGFFDVFLHPEKAQYFLKMLFWGTGGFLLILMIITWVCVYSKIKKSFKGEKQFIIERQIKISWKNIFAILLGLPVIYVVFLGGIDWLSRPPLLIKDPVLFYRFNSNCGGEINTLGFRGSPVFFNKGPSTFRIICMGDSVTFGDHVKFEEAYPKVLEEILNDKCSVKKYEVINAGVYGYTSYQGVLYLREMLKYKPDLITVYFGMNDATPNLLYNDKIIGQKGLYGRFYSLLKFQSLLSKVPFGRKVIYYLFYRGQNKKVRVSPGEYKKNLEEMMAITEKYNIRILFITPLWRDDNAGGALLPRVNYKFPEECLVVDTDNVFRQRSKDIAVFLLDWCHLTAEGHRIVAAETFKFLNEKKLIPE